MKKKGAEEKDNEERWLLTYADLITLLMAFFCILFAMANVDANKFKAVAQSMSLALGGSGGGIGAGSGGGSGSGSISSMNGTSSQLMNLKQNNDFKSIMKMIREYASQKGISKSVKTTLTENGLVISLAESVLYESGSADLSPKAREILDRLAEIIFKINSPIRVEGHTDNVPIHTARYQSNWQLSTERATNVIMYWLSKYPDEAQKLSAAGFGEWHPVASNDTEEGRASNRRVEIALMKPTSNK